MVMNTNTHKPLISTSALQRDLEKDVMSETSGHFKRLLVSMCQVLLGFQLVWYVHDDHLQPSPHTWPYSSQGARDESTAVDQDKAKREAQELFQAGEKSWGTDESKFNFIIASRSFAQLKATFDEYTKVCYVCLFHI